MKELYTYWFKDDKTGEEFLVEIDHWSLIDAYKIAYTNFERPHFIDIVSEEDAEWMGMTFIKLSTPY